MKEIVVISGKGGTGKTSITASFGVLGAGNTVIADCDVDASDLHMLMNPQNTREEDFTSGAVAVIDQDACVHCGRCSRVCRFDAIPYIDDRYEVIPLDCEGCGYCAKICPALAIKMVDQVVGRVFYSDAKTGAPMVHARLHIGAENSGKLVAKVKREAKAVAMEKGYDYVLVDGSPGIGCPVVSSLTGADVVVLVTEPTVSGLHDLKRVHQLVRRFQIPTACIINKADLNSEMTQELKTYLEANDILHLFDIPYDEDFTKCMVEGKTVVEIPGSRYHEIFEQGWRLLI